MGDGLERGTQGLELNARLLGDPRPSTKQLRLVQEAIDGNHIAAPVRTEVVTRGGRTVDPEVGTRGSDRRGEAQGLDVRVGHCARGFCLRAGNIDLVAVGESTHRHAGVAGDGPGDPVHFGDLESTRGGASATAVGPRGRGGQGRRVEDGNVHAFPEIRRRLVEGDDLVGGHARGRGENARAATEQSAFLVGAHRVDGLADVLFERPRECHRVTRGDGHRESREDRGAGMDDGVDLCLSHEGAVGGVGDQLILGDVRVALRRSETDREEEAGTTQLGGTFAGALGEYGMGEVDLLLDVTRSVELLQDFAECRNVDGSGHDCRVLCYCSAAGAVGVSQVPAGLFGRITGL
eukprot:GHVL01037851.1.p2 GENE.GHVL01037851.1~~GHVL01037851.1.p2  ORF type:complete len:349 (-),score=22.04 GHVL01037851.1:36-1082(-)